MYLFKDYEYRRVSESTLDLVCCATIVDNVSRVWWLFHDDNAKQELKDYLNQHKDKIIVSYSAEAEASATISLGLNPLDWKWFDLFLEYRMLQNHNSQLLYGNQLVDGKIKNLRLFGEKGPQNLAAAVYKLCGIVIDTEEKERIRNILINGTDEEVIKHKEDILRYCLSDTNILPKLLKATIEYYNTKLPKRDIYGVFEGSMLSHIKNEALWRGETAVRTAIMVRHGYPINIEWARNLTENIPQIMNDMVRDINRQFPDIKPFKFNKDKFSMDQNKVREWIKKNHREWPLTDTGKYSLKLEAFTDHYNFRHDFPEGNFGAQMVRYLKTAQSLKGFKEAGGSKNNTFWDYVGSDGMVRSYINPYGAQSSRYQPGSVGFLFLKSAWQRSICQAPRGYAVGAIDYSSQEFLLGGAISGDKKMVDAYASGDVYLAYGKTIGVIPPNGTKKTHEKERDAQKPVILGWQYWISEFGLARQLTNITGRPWTPDEAKPLLDQLDETYSTFAEFRTNAITYYQVGRYLKLLDGWYMWGDNHSDRSVANCHVQGTGGCILRKAIQLAQDKGLKVIFPLHDAIYIMFKSTDLEAMQTLRDCMYEAFIYYFKGRTKDIASLIRMDGKAWSMDYQDGEYITKNNFVVKTSEYHIDKRAQREYDQFHKYFITDSGQHLL